jgi:hypothetical protein
VRVTRQHEMLLRCIHELMKQLLALNASGIWSSEHKVLMAAHMVL